MRKRLVHVIISALLGLGLVSGQLAVAPAEAASSPKLTFKTKKVKVKGGECNGKTVKFKVPVLKGSSAANRKQVEKWPKWVENTIQELPDWACDMWPIKAKGEIYQGRYLSVVIELPGWDVGSLNLDLKTGKALKLSRFASNKADIFNLVLCDAAVEPDGFPRAWCDADYPMVYAWRVTKKGIRVYSGLEGAPFNPLIPWGQIVKPDYKTKKKHVTKSVSARWYSGDSLHKSDTQVTVQGNLVTVRAKGKNYYGVRGASMTDGDGKLSWVEVVAPGEYDAGFGLLRFVAFESKTSNKASQYVSYVG